MRARSIAENILPKFKVWMVASEVGRIKSAGGMSDAVHGMAHALAKDGHKVTIVMPCYADSIKYFLRRDMKATHDETLNIPTAGGIVTAESYLASLPVGAEGKQRMSVYLIDSEDTRLFGNRVEIYSYRDRPLGFLLFCRAALELFKKKSSRANNPGLGKRRLRLMDLIPQIIHTHDWPTGFLPYFFRHVEKNIRVALVHSIHNLGYGIEMGFAPDKFFGLTGETNPWVYSPSGMEFHGNIDQTKTAIVFADKIVTVSPSYAQEILAGQTPLPASKYQGILQARRADVHGILNGLPDDFGPQKFAERESGFRLRAPYSPEDLSGKRECRRQLQQSLGLPIDEKAFVLAVSGRWVAQKGIDVAIDNIEAFMSLPIQFVFVGSGEMYKQVMALNDVYPGRFHAHGFETGFDEDLEALYLAGSDALLMPSRFEPCGLAQMKAQKLGTLPIVNGTGGLKDTVADGEDGFVIPGVSFDSIFQGVGRAISTYQGEPSRWEDMIRAAMRHDYSWSAAAKNYVDQIYKEAVARAFRQTLP
jgi:starch synthase